MTWDPEVRLRRTGGATRPTDISKRTETDREQWAGLDSVSYEVSVSGRGEAVSGPYWFGRAFDLPPFFTSSSVAVAGAFGKPVQLTVGVAEWLQDEQDMYVGATLWFAFDTCFESLGGGVLVEENFENILETQGGGPLGNEIIAYQRGLSAPLESGFSGSSGFLWPSLNDKDFGEPDEPPFHAVELYTEKREGAFIEQFVTGDLGPRYRIINDEAPVPIAAPDFRRSGWSVSHENPFDGTHHLRMTQPAYDPVTSSLRGGAQALIVADGLACLYPNNETGVLRPTGPACSGCDEDKVIQGEPVFRIENGMTLKVSCYVMVDNIDDPPNNEVTYELSFFDENAAFVGFAAGMDGGVPAHQIPTSWGKKFTLTHTIEPQDPDVFTVYTFNPNEIHFVLIRIVFDQQPFQPHGPYTAKVWDLDKVRVEITGAPSTGGGGPAAPVFDVSLRFQGQILKSYAVVHKLHQLEAPTTVVLT